MVPPDPETPKEPELPAWLRDMMGTGDSTSADPVDEDADLTESLVEDLGRRGYCSVATKLLAEAFGEGQPYGFKAQDTGLYSHYFLMVRGLAVDMGGPYPVDELKPLIPGEHEAEKITWHDVHKHINSLGMTPEEREIVIKRFKDRISENIDSWRDAIRRWDDEHGSSQASE